jgi:hypothetical protein
MSGRRSMRWHCDAKLAMSTARGSKRWSPQATDQHTKISRVKRISGAVGAQGSVSTSVFSDAHMSATAPAVANIRGRPPRRSASATTPITAAMFTTPIVSGNAATPGRRLGTASSQ